MNADGAAVIGVVGIFVAGITTSGCGGATTGRLEPLAVPPVSSPPPAKHYAHGTGHLRMTITPTEGRVGTEVSIRATGCGDPDGQNHAVSFNPGFFNTMQAARAHYRQGVIRSRLAGKTLTATYTITAEDAAAAARADVTPSKFYVQCSDDDSAANFVITR